MATKELLKKIKRIHIISSHLVNTMMSGRYRSVFRGAGIEFEEVRDYSPGDDVKHIDWRVSARMGRPYVKQYREERERVVMLLVDMSASQWFGTREKTKQETAAEMAAIIAFNAVRNNDKVGLMLFTDRVETYIPPKKGTAHVWRVIRDIFDFHPDQRGTDISSALRYFGRVCRKRAITFLISDFIDSGFMHGLRMASRKHEIIGVLLSDPNEFSLPEAGIVMARDFETGQTVAWDASNKAVRRRYNAQRMLGFNNTVTDFRNADIDLIPIATDQPVADALSRYFKMREKRLR